LSEVDCVKTQQTQQRADDDKVDDEKDEEDADEDYEGRRRGRNWRKRQASG